VSGSCEHADEPSVFLLLIIYEESERFLEKAKYSTCIFVTKLFVRLFDSEDGAGARQAEEIVVW
jgi:hypothetical protein